MSMMWFEHCTVYLNRLEAFDAYVTLCDTLPTVTKKEKEQKRLAFDGLMRVLKEKRDIEADLDELWNLD